MNDNWKFSGLPYTSPDVEALQARYDALTQRAKDAQDPEDLLEVVRQRDALQQEVALCQSIATIRAFHDVTDEFYQRELQETLPRLETLDTQSLSMTIADSPYAAAVDEAFGPQLRRLLTLDQRLHTGGKELQARISRLTAQYQQLAASTKYQVQGETLSGGQLRFALTSTHRERRKAAYDAQQQTAVENGPVMEKLLRELVHARNQLARENGFDSFADYGDLSMQRLGYGRAELDEFCRQVQKYITPLYLQIQEQQRQRQQQVYQQCPELESIQREIRGTMGEIIASALRRGTDPLPAIRVNRDKNLSLQRRRAELLAQLGYPEDYLSEKPRCPLCGDTGYRGDGLCSCLKKYYAQEQIRELSRMLDIGSQSFDTFELDWYSPDRGSLPRSPRENAQRNLNLCRDFAARFRPGRENLLLFGAPGLGKTFLSACIARVVSEDGFSVVYDTAGHVFSQFESAKFRRDDDGDTAGEDVERCMNCDLLILDDLGTEMTTSFVQSALYQLLNGRLLAGKSTVISTNLDPEELGRRYGAPLLSRLEGEYQLLPFVGTDIRRLKREQG